MKKFLCALLTAVLLLSLVACGNTTKNTGDATKISFSQPLSDLKKLENKQVTISGYASMLSPLNGNLIYLLNLPLQSCPFCVPNTTTLSNTIAVELSKSMSDFTTDPLKITGTLTFGNFTDDYGYNYEYKITNATFEVIDEKEVSEKFSVYYTLSGDGYIYNLYDIISCIDMYVYSDDYGYDITTTTKDDVIDFYDYDEVKEKVKSYNSSDYDEFLSMWENAKTLVDKVNELILAETPEKCSELKSEIDKAFEDFNTFINKYEL